MNKDRYERQPTGVSRFPTEGDLQIAKALQRHGKLNTWQLLQLCPHFTSYQTIKWRLFNLFHDPLKGFGYIIDRPASQRKNMRARSTYLYYSLTRYGQHFLEHHGCHEPCAVGAAPPLEHDIFVSTVSFSLDYEARKIEGLEFVPQYQANRAQAESRVPVELDGKQTNLTPDGYVAISLGGVRMYIFKEEDRATENHTGAGRKNTKQTLAQYGVVIGKGKHKSHFDVQSDAILLYSTTNHARLQNVLRYVPDGCEWFLGAAQPECESLETMPSYIPVYDMYWERAGLPPVKILDFLTNS